MRVGEGDGRVAEEGVAGTVCRGGFRVLEESAIAAAAAAGVGVGVGGGLVVVQAAAVARAAVAAGRGGGFGGGVGGGEEDDEKEEGQEEEEEAAEAQGRRRRKGARGGRHRCLWGWGVSRWRGGECLRVVVGSRVVFEGGEYGVEEATG